MKRKAGRRATPAPDVASDIQQKQPFARLSEEATVDLMLTTDVVRRWGESLVASSGVTLQQYNVLRILRGAGEAGLPTLVIRDRMIHEAPGITRLLDKLEAAGLARRERTSPDRRQVFCYITPGGLSVLDALDVAMKEADDVAVGSLTEEEQRTLIKLLERVRTRR